MLIELVVVLAIVLILNVLSFGFGVSISRGEILLLGGAIFFGILGARLLINRLTEGLMGGGSGRGRGPAAEGLALLRRGDLRAAEFAFRRCLERHPGEVEALRGLAEIVVRRGDVEQYLQLTSQALSKPDALMPGDRVALCHRQADVCLERLNDPRRAVEALARIELDYPGTTDALRARQRIERMLKSDSDKDSRENRGAR